VSVYTEESSEALANVSALETYIETEGPISFFCKPLTKFQKRIEDLLKNLRD